MERPHPDGALVLLGAGHRALHGYALKQIASARPVVIFDEVLRGWARPYATRFVPVNTDDRALLARALDELAQETPVAGVMSYLAEHTGAAALLAHRSHLPGTSMAMVPPDGKFVRRALVLQGIPLAHEENPGARVTAECAVLGPGQVRLVAVVRRHTAPGPWPDAVDYTLQADDQLLGHPPLHDIVRRTVTALGVGLGLVRVHLTLTGAGPRVTGAETGVGNSLLPHLVQLATGVTLPSAAAALATGGLPELTPRRSHAAGIRFLYSAGSGMLRSAAVRHPLTSRRWLERFEWMHNIGDEIDSARPVHRYGDPVGYGVVLAPTAQECRHRLLQVGEHVHIQVGRRRALAGAAPP
ncbi:hypothetical protein ACFQVC_39230 [Streptomyces monticola]|uniref:ATP-grasp domain-containing protein n=1 Tax=Streptomyces monticola TaxID=2666263 RepID=A0ABW2JX02_9ACTN